MSGSVKKDMKELREEVLKEMSNLLESRGIGVAERKEKSELIIRSLDNLSRNMLESRLVNDFYDGIVNYGKNYRTNVEFIKSLIREIGTIVNESNFIKIENDLSGFSQVVDDSHVVEMFEKITSMEIGSQNNPMTRIMLLCDMICVLDFIVTTYKEVIESYTKNDSPDLNSILLEYCEKILDSSEETPDQSTTDESTEILFTSDKFIPVVWKNDQQKMFVVGDKKNVINPALEVQEFVLNNDNVRFVGPAGEGKTWTMKYLQCECCKMYKESKGAAGFVAVLISLRDFNDAKNENKCIEDLIQETLKIADQKVLEEVLNSGKSWIFLDGINEIFVKEKRTNVRNFVKNHPSCRFVISDRETVNDSYRDFKEYQLRALDATQIEWYFKKNSAEKYIGELRSNGRLGWLKEVRVAPYMLEVLMRFAMEGKYPAKNDFDREYLLYLLRRELDQLDPLILKAYNLILKKVAEQMILDDTSKLDETEFDKKFDVVSKREKLDISRNGFVDWAENISILRYDNSAKCMEFENLNYRDYYADNNIIGHTGKIVGKQ